MVLKLIDKKKITLGVSSFVFKSDEPVKWIAGQYLIYTLRHANEDLRGKMRFFTISSSPFEKNPTITTRIVKKPSSFKKTLDNLKIGQTIEAKGPDGDFVIKDLKKNYVFIAGGIGITPFISIIRELNFENKPINVTLLYANKNEDVVFRKELDEIAAHHPEFKIYYVISPLHIDGKLLSNLLGDLKKYIFYVSGPDPMVDAILNLLESLEVPKQKIKDDYFSGYKRL